jgi:hypothetical protein
MSRMSEYVGASTSRNPKGLHGLYGDNFTLYILLLLHTYLVLQYFYFYLLHPTQYNNFYVFGTQGQMCPK